jgi:hypothetical protein
MVFKWSGRNKDKESDPNIAENKTSEVIENITTQSDKRDSIKSTIDLEIRGMIEDEIKNAAKEIAEEQKIVIRVAVEEQKRIIREVLEQEKQAIQARKEDIRQSLTHLGMG